MTTALGPFPYLARALLDLLADLGTVGTETRPGLQTALPYIRATRTGGADDRFTDSADVEVSVFTTDATAAMTLALQIQARLLGGPFAGPSFDTAHGRIDQVRTITAPVPVPPTDSDNLRQVTASYQVSARR